jgi:hypothetical protein
MFDRLIHADWSVNAGKRWAATAERRGGTWIVQGPSLVAPGGAFLDGAFETAQQQRVLLGFDFPIGVPLAYGSQTGFRDFRELLPALGRGAWGDFFDVARMPAEIGIKRPFYPSSSNKGVTRAELTMGLSVSAFDDLLRVCERRTVHRQAACSLFWTLGGNQVGKAAISGWKDVVQPALLRGAVLWPFDGALGKLARFSGVVIAETYPAEAYRLVGAGFPPGQSKRRQADRRGKAASVLRWANRHGVSFSASAAGGLADGFGSLMSGEDQFDALLGLLKMIEVVEGRRPARTERHEAIIGWEGWILGR